MSNILVINSGSTSIKYKLFDGNEKEIKAGIFEDVIDYDKTIKSLLREIGDLRDIAAVGHRVVHGGEKFFNPIIVDGTVFEELKKISYLAPLHNPYNLAGIKAVENFLPDVPQIAVFDTAFYAGLPDVSRLYALPKEISDEYGIRRYGFHGISHRFVMEEASKQLGLPINKINLISCHLGGGWSVTAVKNGKAIDTSMGFTPLEGLMMMTRSGDLDPGIVMELIKKSNNHLGGAEDVEKLLNHKSGISGLAEVSSYLELLKEVARGNEKAKLAFDMAMYRLSKYIASYWVVLAGKVDAIVFTGAIGAGDVITRNEIMLKLKCLGAIPALAIKPNEELAIMREVEKILNGN